MISTKEVKNLAIQFGFDLVAVNSAHPLEEDRLKYQDWCQEGFAGELSYMTREFPRRWMPQDLLPEAKSIMTFGVNFFSGPKKIESKKGYGRIARYAWGKDYHEVIKKRLEEFIKTLKENIGSDLKTKILVDSSPFLERAFAQKGGLGFFGKNSLIISHQYGSYIFLSEILTDLEIEPDHLKVDKIKDCGKCFQCIERCPTQALQKEKMVDTRRCISYWTIENRGDIPLEIRPKIGDWIFGCDICQEVCPYLGVAKETRWKEFLPESGIGSHLSLLELLLVKSNEEFKEKFEGTNLLRAKRSGLIRNGCVVCVNQKFSEAIPLLEKLSKNDSELLIRDYASWALGQLKK